MDTEPLYKPKKTKDLTESTRDMILQSLVSMASSLVSSQVEAFTTRLAQNLQRHANQSLRADDARINLEAYQFLSRNSANYYRLLAGYIHSSLSKEVSVFNTRKRIKKDEYGLIDPNQTFPQIETDILIRHLSQLLEMQNAPALIKLNALIGCVLNRTPIDVTQNPFRPELFVSAVYNAWTELAPNQSSHLLLLRSLNQADFLQLTPIYNDIIDGLISRGISSSLPEKHVDTMLKLDASAAFKQSDFDPYLNDKLKYVLTSDVALPVLGINLNVENDTESHISLSETEENQALNGEVVDSEFFNSLVQLQKELQNNALVDAGDATHRTYSSLRKLLVKFSAHNFNIGDRNTIELMARVFDYIFADKNLSDEIKYVISQLQIPVLHACMNDKDFFFKAQHPARSLLDILGRTCISFDHNEETDPFLPKIHEVIERVQLDFEAELDLFSDAVVDLENFFHNEDQQVQHAISQAMQEALNQEKMDMARKLAEHDVAIRLDTGEVPGFLDEFLYDQWTRILTLAHSIKDEKPHALENALKTMDDLIWSLRPKNSPESRKELLNKLPALLTLLHAWLNAIRWDDPARVIFFSKLAERHAAIARAPLELSPRQQLEIAVNIAQRASNRRLVRFSHDPLDGLPELSREQLDTLEVGTWLLFHQNEGESTRYKLVWISPQRGSFIFATRRGAESFSISADELIEQLAMGSVSILFSQALTERALIHALREVKY
jgi:hypothetical protein